MPLQSRKSCNEDTKYNVLSGWVLTLLETWQSGRFGNYRSPNITASLLRKIDLKGKKQTGKKAVVQSLWNGRRYKQWGDEVKSWKQAWLKLKFHFVLGKTALSSSIREEKTPILYHMKVLFQSLTGLQNKTLFQMNNNKNHTQKKKAFPRATSGGSCLQSQQPESRAVYYMTLSQSSVPSWGRGWGRGWQLIRHLKQRKTKIL